MVPKRGMDVKLTDRYLLNNSSLLHLKGVKLNVMKVDLKLITSGGYAEYVISFMANGYIQQLTIDQKGQIGGCDVFESWVTKATAASVSAPLTFDFGNDEAPPAANAAGDEPKNNDGRTTCYWCGAPTKNVPGAFSSYDICTNPACQK